MISFQGFKPSGIEKIANAMGFQGEEKDFQKFLEENPDRQAEMMRYQDIARKMVEGGLVGMQSGGVSSQRLDEESRRLASRGTSAVDMEMQRASGRGPLFSEIGLPRSPDSLPPRPIKKKNIRDISLDRITDPRVPQGASVSPYGIPTGDKGQMIDPSSGQVSGVDPQAEVTRAYTTRAESAGRFPNPRSTGFIEDPDVRGTTTMDAETSIDKVTAVTEATQAAQLNPDDA